jgi:Fe-S cluster assembly ATP-binding protein
MVIEIENLTVSVEGKKILKDINLYVSQGETVALFGPNGSGKTSLFKTIIGIPVYKVESGRILFKGEDITGLTIDERARLGIGIAFQHPPEVRGVKLKNMMNICMEQRGDFKKGKIGEFAQRLNLQGFLERDINVGFSGGETKRSELLQLLAQNPDFILLDEPDSGVDLVSIHLVTQVINELLEKKKRARRRAKAGLIITHAGHILDYVNADRAYVMLDGTSHCFGNPMDLLEDIRTRGYEGCVKCPG